MASMSFQTPSWSDAVHATVGSCLSCLRQNSGDSADEDSNAFNRRPPRHLESLLADVQDTDTEAETVSLHSNVGDSQAAQRRRQRKKKRAGGARSISFFGFDLFGKRTGAIRLPDSDEEEDGTSGDDGTSRRQRQRQQRGQSSGTAGTTGSSSASLTFDSDAASLDPAVIDDLTPEQLEERARLAEAEAIEARARADAAEAERRKEKEERRRKRRERKEMKRMAEAMARNENGTGEFEGFQGSADVIPPGYMQAQPVPGYVYGYDEHGELSQHPPQSHIPSSNPQVLIPVDQQPQHLQDASVDIENDDTVDLGGSLYAGRKRDYRNRATGGSSAGDSDSRSRTSASRSETSTSQLASPAGYHHPHLFQQHPQQYSPVSPFTPEQHQQQGYAHPHPAYDQQVQYVQSQFDPNHSPSSHHPQYAVYTNPQQSYAPQAPLSLPALQTLDGLGGKKKSSSSKSKSSKSSEASSVSHTSQSQSLQSPSLASPVSGVFPPSSLPQAFATSEHKEKEKSKEKSSSTVTTPLTLTGDIDELDELDEFGVDPDRVGGDAVLVEAPSFKRNGTGVGTGAGFPSPGLKSGNSDKGFPSTGFGFGGSRNAQKSGMSGAFLANVGKEERERRSASPDLDI